jgi:hypothetical protein
VVQSAAASANIKEINFAGFKFLGVNSSGVDINMRKAFILFALFILSVRAFGVYDVNENCKKAWMLLMDLRIAEAKELLAHENRLNPQNYYAYYLDQTCDAYGLFINSDKADFEKFEKNYDSKREIMNGHDEDSPYYLACAAEMEIQVCIFGVIHGSQWSAYMKGYSAYKDTYHNLDRFPDFKPGRKLDGFFNVALANMPPFVKWLIGFFGVSADIDYGFRVLNENYQAQKNIMGLNAEAALFKILAANINKTPELVYEFSKSLDSSFSGAYIFQYFRANLAYRTGRNEEALKDLEKIKNAAGPYAGLTYNYLMGKALLRKLDPGAKMYILKYAGNLRKEEYRKEMNYNLALYYLINGDRQKYLDYCKIVVNAGTDINERDHEALYEAKLDYAPDVNLVQARLLLDGGYYDTYLNFIQQYLASQDELPAHKLEYQFLSARYDASQSNFTAAIKGFEKVIELGEDEDYYFASEAALRLGNIYRDMGQVELAKKYYEQSIKLYDSDYFEYILDKAKKGLNSL